MRVGFGYDVHRLVPGRDLILGGVKIEHELGLLGHSDADVLLWRHIYMGELSHHYSGCSRISLGRGTWPSGFFSSGRLSLQYHPDLLKRSASSSAFRTGVKTHFVSKTNP